MKIFEFVIHSAIYHIPELKRVPASIQEDPEFITYLYRLTMKSNSLKLIFIIILTSQLIHCTSEEKKQGDLAESVEEVILVQDTIIYEISSFQEAADLITELKYTPEDWQAGIREIPRLTWMKVPERWRTTTSKEIEVKVKKQIFFRVLAPLTLQVNEGILKDRERLLSMLEKSNESFNSEDKQWLLEMAEAYRVEVNEINEEVLNKLLIKVDIIPVSLALAQSAEESGWGTSRFAAEGNALFGQWAWGKDAMKPKEQREGMGDYGLRKFDTPLESMKAYIHNLNTHPAYEDLRRRRAELREAGKPITGQELANTLTKYSERGAEYVETLQALMRVNRLAQADEAYLSDGPVILVVPVE